MSSSVRATVLGALAFLCAARVVAAAVLGTWDGEATAATLGLLLLLWSGWPFRLSRSD